MCRRLISLISKWPARQVKMWCKQTSCTLTDADIRFRLEITETWQSRRSNWWICEWMKENRRQDTAWSQLGKRPVTRQHDWLLQTIYTKRMWMSTIQFCITTILQITKKNRNTTQEEKTDLKNYTNSPWWGEKLPDGLWNDPTLKPK